MVAYFSAISNTSLLLIDKAIIHGKRFASESKIIKTTNVFPLKIFAIYGILVVCLLLIRHHRVVTEETETVVKFSTTTKQYTVNICSLKLCVKLGDADL